MKCVCQCVCVRERGGERRERVCCSVLKVTGAHLFSVRVLNQRRESGCECSIILTPHIYRESRARMQTDTFLYVVTYRLPTIICIT